MLSFLRRVLWRDDKLNTGQCNNSEESPSQSYNCHVNVVPDYGTFSTTKPNISPVYNHVKFDIDGQVDIPQKPNISPVYNQPKQITPRIPPVKVNPEKTPDIPTATHTNVILKSTNSSSSPFGAPPGSPKAPTVFTKPILRGTCLTTGSYRSVRPIYISCHGPEAVGHERPSMCRKDVLASCSKPILACGASTPASNQTKSQYNIVEKGWTPTPTPTPLNVIPDDIKGLIREDKSEHLQQSTSKRNPKRAIKLDQKLKFTPLRKTLQKGNDYPQTSRKPPRTLPAKDAKVDIDGQSTGSSTITETYINCIKQSGLSTVPARRSLADYLRESGPRLVSLYGSKELYPTDEARCIIQGMVRAILNLKKGGRKHNYLRHPENLILGDKECHPYSNYVRDLATEHVIRNRKILEQAGQDFPTSIEVTLEKNRIDSKSDDLEALKCLIFDVILVSDDGKKPLLPAEWKSFKKLFSNNKLDYAVLSSHPCLWGYTKRLGFYIALAKWRYPSKSEKGVIDIVDDTLSSMKIFRTKWVERIKKDSHLLKFADQMTRFRQRKVCELIRFFRNLVEHCPDKASPSSPYRKERYLDYKLRTIYPNLLEELHQRLLLAGFIY